MRKMMPPRSRSVANISRETGISALTLYAWKKQFRDLGRNWKGIGTTVDQIYFAEANRRSRFFNFCLVENNGPQVLCGRTQIRGVTQSEPASKLPKIMAVLTTIEFVDPSAALASPAGAATVH